MIFRAFHSKEVTCQLCGSQSVEISELLGVCGDCIRNNPSASLPHIKLAHKKTRAPYNLPAKPPNTPSGIQCNFCANECTLGEDDVGFCGLRRNEDGQLLGAGSKQGLLSYYLDPHVTNCCAAWFCPAGTGQGYPRYAYRAGAEHGYSNLAVFFYGCNFDCLFCQNATHKELPDRLTSVDNFVKLIKANEKISCICYFGGSPEPQLPFALKVSKRAIEIRETAPKNNILRICFEWNGCGNSTLVKKATKLVLESGGNIKFDLKAPKSSSTSLALSGIDNTKAFENFKMIARKFYDKRPDVPVLMASTLLVPGYVTSVEVEKIAQFIAGINPNIPYSLLAFHPAFKMTDMPTTSLKQAKECYQVARKYLNRVHVGNLHLLGVRSQNELL